MHINFKKQYIMKTTRTLLIAIIMTGLSAALSAQPVIGLKGGINSSTFYNWAEDNYSSEGGSFYEYKPKLGINFGLIAELPITDEFYFQSGIGFTQKGLKEEGGEPEYYSSSYGFEPGYEYTNKYSLLYLNIPFNALYKLELDDHYLLAFTGPALNLGLTGKIKYSYDIEGPFDDETDEEEIKWGNDEYNDHFKRVDLGWLFGIGFQYEELLQLRISYELGLNHISSWEPYDEFVTKNRVFQVSAVFLLSEMEIF